MTTLSPTRARRRSGPAQGSPAASIREVCLIGSAAGRPASGSGDAIRWAGRGYRVVAVDGGDVLYLRPAEEA